MFNDHASYFLDDINCFHVKTSHDDFQAAIDAGSYDCVDPRITADNFGIIIEPFAIDTIITIHQAKRFTYIDKLLVELAEQGLQPALLLDLLALGELYPDLQHDFTVVCLGSLWIDALGVNRCVCLGDWQFRRELYLESVVDGWDKDYSFAAVPIPAQQLFQQRTSMRQLPRTPPSTGKLSC